MSQPSAFSHQSSDRAALTTDGWKLTTDSAFSHQSSDRAALTTDGWKLTTAPAFSYLSSDRAALTTDGWKLTTAPAFSHQPSDRAALTTDCWKLTTAPAFSHQSSDRAALTTDGCKLTTDSGFTLLEIIVALVVLGFIMAGLAQAQRFGIAAWSLETRMADDAAALERMDRVLRRLIEQACPPVTADDKPFSGEEHRLVFMTLMPDEPQTQPIRRAQVSIGVDDHHRLVLRWQPHPNATLIGIGPPIQEVVLAQGLERIDLAYRQAAADGGKWSKSWSESGLPSVVQIHFVLSNGHHRWPDMAVPTMLDPNGSF